MTKQKPTVTDHINWVLDVLNKEAITESDITAVEDRLQKALADIQLARSEVQSALERF